MSRSWSSPTSWWGLGWSSSCGGSSFGCSPCWALLWPCWCGPCRCCCSSRWSRSSRPRSGRCSRRPTRRPTGRRSACSCSSAWASSSCGCRVWCEVQAESHVGDVPFRRRERLNLALVALISESLQVAFVSGAVWLFYVLLGALLVSAEVRGAWLLQPTTVIWDVAWFGERVQVTAALLRVATGVAGFAGLYYAVTILVDSAYRDQFVDTLGEQLRDTFERRSEYLELLRRRGVAVAPGEPTQPRPARRESTNRPTR